MISVVNAADVFVNAEFSPISRLASSVCFMFASISKPFMFGILMSVMTKSNGVPYSFCKPTWPSSASSAST